MNNINDLKAKLFIIETYINNLDEKNKLLLSKVLKNYTYEDYKKDLFIQLNPYRKTLLKNIDDRKIKNLILEYLHLFGKDFNNNTRENILNYILDHV